MSGKYRQLWMHLNSALRLLGELGVVNEGLSTTEIASNATDLKAETTKAMAALTKRLRAVSRRAACASDSRTSA